MYLTSIVRKAFQAKKMATNPLSCCTNADGSITSLAMNVLEQAAPIFEEVMKHEIDNMLIEDAKRYIYIAQMINSKEPLKKAKKMIEKIKKKIKN